MPNTIRLRKDAERRIKAGHLWIFSNEIDTNHKSLQHYAAGELVTIETSFGKPIAIGYINPHCLLCIRILSLNVNDSINTDFFIKKITQAQIKRQHLFEVPYYRAVFGESDRLPGVVIDRFNDVVIAQINTAGMEQLKQHLLAAIIKVFQPKVLFLKCDSTERKQEGLESYTETVLGDLPELLMVEENENRYFVALETAQKTGWFYDHRLNRARIASYCKNKRVLDVFSYCGAFTIACAKAGAQSVIAVDRSNSALAQLKRSALENKCENIHTICSDAAQSMEKMQQENEKFDVIILDPPALIKRKKDVGSGEKYYQFLNELALRLLKPNGILLSASCSMHLSAERLLNIIRRAGIRTNKEVSVLEQCHQGPDHPIHASMPETNYLKGFIIISA